MKILGIDSPRIFPPSGFQRPDRLVPTDVAMDLAVPGILFRPFFQKVQAFLSLAKLIVKVTADVSGVRIARIAAQCRLDVAKAVLKVMEFDFGERQHRAEPPIITIGRGEWAEYSKLFYLP